MLVVQIPDEHYQRRIFLAVGTNPEVKAHLKEKWGKKAIKGWEKNARGLLISFPAPVEGAPDTMSKVWYIWLYKFDGSNDDFATLAHECFHCATSICDYIGLDMDDEEGSEVHAWWLDFLIRKCLEILRTP